MLATATFMNRYISQRVLPDDFEEKELVCRFPSPIAPPSGASPGPIPPPPPPPPPRLPTFVSHDNGKRQNVYQERLEQAPGAAGSALDCPICWEEGEAWRKMPACPHSFCHDCIRTTCATAAADGKLVVPCPGKDCDQDYLPATLAQFLTPKTVRQFQANNQRALEFNSLACPTCLWLAKRDLGDSHESRPGGVLIDHSCEGPGCNASFCLRCGQASEAHEERVCESALAEKEKEEECLQFTREGAQRCPHCLIYTVKEAGCDWIKCGRCTHEWCWVGSSWSAYFSRKADHLQICLHPHNHYQHGHTINGVMQVVTNDLLRLDLLDELADINHVYDRLLEADLPVEALRFAQLAQQRKRRKAAKAVAIGAGLVLASPVLLVAGIAALAVAPFAAAVAAPVVAGVAVKRKIESVREKRRLEEQRWWREGENQLGANPPS